MKVCFVVIDRVVSNIADATFTRIQSKLVSDVTTLIYQAPSLALIYQATADFNTFRKICDVTCEIQINEMKIGVIYLFNNFMIYNFYN